MISVSLPAPPAANNLYANIPGRGRVKSARYRSWLQAAGNELMAQRPAMHPKRISGDYILTIAMERPDGRRRDLGNTEKALSDLLVAHGVVDDDSRAVEIHLRWEGSGRRCRVEIEPAASVQARAAA